MFFAVEHFWDDFLVNFDECFPNHALALPEIVFLCFFRAFFSSEKSFVCAAEMSTDQDWIGLDQDWSQFWPDQEWIGLQFFSKLEDQVWIGLRKFMLLWCDYSKNMKYFSCDPISQVC